MSGPIAQKRQDAPPVPLLWAKMTRVSNSCFLFSRQFWFFPYRKDPTSIETRLLISCIYFSGIIDQTN